MGVASNYSNHLSPPHSNLSSHHVQSPPHSTGAMSPPNSNVMSPPQSLTMSPPQTSQHSMSPPQQQLTNSSPAKSRLSLSTQLPTSPTHLAALRGATHQRHQQQASSFDFPTAAAAAATGNPAGDVQMYMHPQHQQFLYPTPPQEQIHNSFMSPSPDSPDQWSSASPQSHSDWSDGIHSPPSALNGHYHQHHLQLQQQQIQYQQQMIQQANDNAA